MATALLKQMMYIVISLVEGVKYKDKKKSPYHSCFLLITLASATHAGFCSRQFVFFYGTLV